MKDISTLTDLLAVVVYHFYQRSQSDAADATTVLRREIEDFDIAVTAATQQGDINNHEQASRLIATGRDLR